MEYLRYLLVVFTIVTCIFSMPTSKPKSTTRKTPTVTSNSSRVGLINEKRIVGGKRSGPNAWPWMVAIYKIEAGNKKTFLCGGAIINKRYIITAAHCMVPGASGNKVVGTFDVLIGTNQLNTGGQRLAISRVLVPEEYDNSKHYHDIALLRTQYAINFTDKIKAIGLPPRQVANHSYAGKSCTVAGFGSTSYEGNTVKQLRDVALPIMSLKECVAKYKTAKFSRLPRGVIGSQICAGPGSKDACQGDSGGPLMVKENNSWKILGIVSFGVGCAHPDFPGVYTRVDRFLPWISQNSNPI